MGDPSGGTESQFDRPGQYFLAAWSCGGHQTVVVDSASSLGFPFGEVNEPIEVLLILLGHRVLDAVDANRSLSGLVANGRVIRLVVHKDHIAGLIAERIPTRQVLRTQPHVISRLFGCFSKSFEMTSRDNVQTAVVRPEGIQIDCRSHAKETFGCTGVVVPWRTPGQQSVLKHQFMTRRW